jgi:hypothetical protein
MLKEWSVTTIPLQHRNVPERAIDTSREEVLYTPSIC